MSSLIPALISANELTLAYGHQNLLNGVTLSVAPGEKVGLVGRNGCGKTSLLKILAGVDKADSGDLSRRRGLRIGYLPQEFELDGTKTVQANIEAGAADLLEWRRRYEAGEGTDAELDDFLEKIQHADGWNLESRIKAEASALDAPRLDALRGVEALLGGAPPQHLGPLHDSLRMSARRAKLINFAITFCTITAILVCAVVGILFVGVFFKFDVSALIATLFVTGMSTFIVGLLFFLREIFLATASLRIGPH